MKNTLIINLKRRGDIISTSHLANSLLVTYPDIKITLLVFEEFSDVARNISGISSVETIDRKKILTYEKNKIFSDAFALDEFFTSISEITEQKWDMVINYSNDRVSTHLVSMLEHDNFYGVKFDEYCNVVHSSEWSILFNEILTKEKFSPLSFIDSHRHNLGLAPQTNEIKLKTHEKYNSLAAKNFSKIRTANDEKCKIIGIQLLTSMQSKNISSKSIIRLIDMILENEHYVPVLLCAPSERERSFVSKINAEFNNSLISVESDFNALSSVLANIDLLITPDTVTKHAANAMNTPCLEISLGPAPMFKQGTCGLGDYVLTPNTAYREFTIKNYEERSEELDGLNDVIEAKDIFQVARHMLEQGDENAISLNDGVALYKVSADSLGRRLSFVKGATNAQNEIIRIINRQYLIQHFYNREDTGLYEDIYRFSNPPGSKEIEKWKIEITETSKILLGAIRSIIQVGPGSKGIAKDLILQIDQLISRGEKEGVCSIALKLMKGKIDSLRGTDAEKNLSEIEIYLYELKSDIQKVFNIVKAVESKIKSIRDNEIIESYRAEI